MQRARSTIIAEIQKELDKIINKYKLQCDNYIVITNIPLSAVKDSGTLDSIYQDIFSRYRKHISNMAIWGADDINRFLDLYPEVRRPYLSLLVSGDVIAELLNLVEQPLTDRALTIEFYLRTTITREENAQLDQAGDVSEEPVPLQRVFFDLDAYVASLTREAFERLQRKAEPTDNLPFGDDNRRPIVKYLINAPISHTVLVGGPGEGKSTIGQYLAQLHRSVLLNKSPDEIALSPEYVPTTPRIPFRIVLRDFAQWLAGRSAESSESDNLDRYISEQVSRLSSRDFSDRDLHEILKGNPVLLVLDGLDEVTEPAVRKRLISRLIEFIDRAEDVLRANLQVIATTRPTGYGEQFDPKRFVHFRLHKLLSNQVRDYVSKWAVARKLDEPKAARLRETIEECLNDPQISLLTTTPLQVTILILVINSGGTPPRQREALFDEYLEVIYKREKAKGLGIVKSEKERLIGLHRYVGYLLQEEATQARTSAAALSRSEYDKVVQRYLRLNDPFSPTQEIEDEWRAITIDAGERLVLIVESPADVFGFELRSIQEFFAASYLADTAADTAQRYERFSAISRLPYWRNVALFFAGRVGRSYPGEAANVVEVCRQLDRSGPDLFAKRGAELALELAADRALEPNRVLQRSLLEHGLSIVEARLSAQAQDEAIEQVSRLPFEDIRDHVLPVLTERSHALGSKSVLNIARLLGQVAPDCSELREFLLRLASTADDATADDIVGIIASSDVSDNLRLEIIGALVNASVDPSRVGGRLAFAPWSVVCAVADSFYLNEVNEEVVRAFSNSAIFNSIDMFSYGRVEDATPRADWNLSVVLLTVRALGSAAVSRNLTTMSDRRVIAVGEGASSGLPEEVRVGAFELEERFSNAAWILWLAHLGIGEVTHKSWERFAVWFNSANLDDRTLEIWRRYSAFMSPIVALIVRSKSVEVEGLGDIAVKFGGIRGTVEWIHLVRLTQQSLLRVCKAEYAKVVIYGPGVLSSELLATVSAALKTDVAEYLWPIVFNWLDNPHVNPKLTVEEVGRLSQWTTALPRESPWRTENLAYRVLVRCIRLRLYEATYWQVFLGRANSWSVGRLIILAAGTPNFDESCMQQLMSMQDVDWPGVFFRVDVTVLRRTLLRLVEFSGSANENVKRNALSAIIALCRSTSTEDTSGRRAIRSRKIDALQHQLLRSDDDLSRRSGMALYCVRPPRSAADWRELSNLLINASNEEVDAYWSWIIPAASRLANSPDTWILQLTTILGSDVGDDLYMLITDVLRKLLPRQDQSLRKSSALLDLPTP